MNNTDQIIVFFDGVCGLCNRFIDWVLLHDHQKKINFAPLQGPTAAERINNPDLLNRMDTVVLFKNGKLYRKSEAVFLTLAELGGFWKWVSILRFIPRMLRDSAYDVVAANRYQLFGRSESCRLPSPEEKDRFLP